jgi:hypothetical protein
MFLGRTPPYSTSTRNAGPLPYKRSSAYQEAGYIGPLEDDYDIDWKHNPFDVDFIEDERESPDELMSKITFKESPQLQTRLRALVREFIDVFATKVRREPADVEPMKTSGGCHLIVNHLVSTRRRSRKRLESKLMHSSS